ncbi:methylated-DNA--[protein]-cysteine S-methyltransferase [Nitrospirales bacterium NOB]|nr:Methylated-DNA--protein-cysteine methyltransferase [Nitrospirota bacterium]MCE7963831.1 methylated-DNA--[protein]-cysteine S-methyltransferase [Nitrospira sp. NTP2]MDL1889255.1 methylated-DNA--[protein]-cysteine S-methyltransferase [Nitrospirales bacterium NOB]RIK61302.1 MAG: cysteine methyltransferase [Nitrospira sp.]
MRAIIFQSSWGWVTVAASSKGVTAIDLSPTVPRKEVFAAACGEDAAVTKLLGDARAQLLAYFAGTMREFSLPLDLSGGTSFQRKVWTAIQRIPYGRVRSYQWVALRVGGKQYARAVGMALGANPVPVVVPCHRIIAHDGSLGGFSCGLTLKRRLLALEGTLAQLRRVR